MEEEADLTADRVLTFTGGEIVRVIIVLVQNSIFALEYAV